MVTVSPHIDETISRMAKLTGQSKSSIVAELLETIHPPLMRTVALLEAAADAPHQVRQGLKQTVEQLERQAQATADLQVAQMDWLQSAMAPPTPPPSQRKGEKRAHPQRPARRGAAARDPRPSNTGVRSPQPKKKGK